MKKRYWKFLRTGLVSNYRYNVPQLQWVIGEWQTVKPPEKECHGLNCSEYVIDALRYVQGEILAIVY